MILRAVLVDDEPLALRRLAIALQDIDGVEVVGTASDGNAAAELIADKNPDFAILDIQMPGRTGLSVAAGLPQDIRPEVIFLTAFEHYAPDAFDVEAADYLLKPVRIERLRQAIERVRRRIALRDARSEATRLAAELEARAQAAADAAPDDLPNALWVPGRGGDVRVGAASIIWIEAAGDYAVLHTQARSHMLRMTLTELEKVFSPHLIRRVHRSAMVNMSLVQEVRRPGRGALTLIVDTRLEVPVGPAYAQAVQSALKLG